MKKAILDYNQYDSDKILDFLNKCYCGWGDRNLLEWKYNRQDNNKTKAIVIEDEDKIIGYRGLLFRRISFASRPINTVSFGDTAVDPKYRNKGIYKCIQNDTISYAKRYEVDFIITWNAIGGTTYNNNLKNGFLAFNQKTFIKIINYEKIIGIQFRQMAIKSKFVKKFIQEFKANLLVKIDSYAPMHIDTIAISGKTESLSESKYLLIVVNSDFLEIFSSQGSSMTYKKIKKIVKLIFLFLTLKLKIIPSSPIVLIDLIKAGVIAIAGIKN